MPERMILKLETNGQSHFSQWELRLVKSRINRQFIEQVSREDAMNQWLDSTKHQARLLPCPHLAGTMSDGHKHTSKNTCLIWLVFTGAEKFLPWSDDRFIENTEIFLKTLEWTTSFMCVCTNADSNKISLAHKGLQKWSTQESSYIICACIANIGLLWRHRMIPYRR